MYQDFECIRNHAPCYVYDSDAVRRNCDRLVSSLPQVKLLYSVKTNPFDPVVKIMAEKGFGADAASANEVLKAEKVGIAPENVFYSTPGKTPDDIKAAWGKCVFVADSLHELDLLDGIAMEHKALLRVGIRIHPLSGFNQEEGTSKFGIDEEILLSTDLGKYRHLVISGIHVHLQSQVLDADRLALYYQRCFDLALNVSKLPGADIRFVNFGSGIGMVYDAATQSDVDLDRLASTLDAIERKNAETLSAALFIETGRFVVGNAGRYYTIVTDIKESRGTKYLIVRNGLNGFSRPAFAQLIKNACGSYPERGMEPLYTCGNEFSVRVLNDEQQQETITIVGDLCTAQDVICRNVTVNKANIGDLIEITNAGSYGFSLSLTGFASHDEPTEIMI